MEKQKNNLKTNVFITCIKISEWTREIEKAEKHKRKPRLRNAMFRLFAPSFILDGFLVIIFILLR